MLELRHGENLDNSKVIGIFPTERGCYAEIWCRENFSSPYFRTRGTEFAKTVDYGSHSLFYFIIKLSDEEI